jgi:hypothetical protein
MSNTEIARNLYRAWENRDLQQAASLLSDSFVLTGPAPVPLNKEAYLTFQNVHNEAFSGWSFNPQGFVVDCIQFRGPFSKLTSQATSASSNQIQGCGGHDLVDVLWRKKFRIGYNTSKGANIAVNLCMVVTKSSQNLLGFGWRRRQVSKLKGHLKTLDGLLVALSLVGTESFS